MIDSAEIIRKNYKNNRRLVVVSNRVPSISVPGYTRQTRKQTVGGLVSALCPVLEERGGLWFGWNGNTTPYRRNNHVRQQRLGSFDVVTIDLSENEVAEFYIEFCNRTLWPLFHGFIEFVRSNQDKYQIYQRINRRFALTLAPLLRTNDLVWIHDYHLFPLGAELRALGWNGPLGFFLHIPFPPGDIFRIRPWLRPILEDLTVYDLLGFHTHQYAHNFVEAATREIGGSFDGGIYRNGTASVKVGTYPIGIDPERFKDWSSHTFALRFGQRLRRMVQGRRIVLGVDRLDYTKGIPERFLAFERLLELNPSWRGRVLMIQISAPSRTQVAEYRAQRNEVDRLVNKINKRFSTADWTPIHLFHRPYSQEKLAALYREADVCLVTPLRDGMNLVGKEFVASQTGDPGVLVLSKFCGAAEEMKEAIRINPHDTDRTTEAIERALEMPLEERKSRMNALVERVYSHTAKQWADGFLADLIYSNLRQHRLVTPRRSFPKAVPA